MKLLWIITAVAYIALLVPCRAESLPRVLFYADPTRSDNEIARRAKPDEPSPVERAFSAVAKGVFDVHTTNNAAEVTREKLKNYQAVVFFTAGNPPADKEAIIEWVRAGGAFTGIHCTANTWQGFAPFGEMLGARYERRPWRTKENPLTKARILVEDREHRSTRHLGESFEIIDDLYLYKDFDQANAHILLRMDPTSLDMTKVPNPNQDMPIAWTRSFGKGRVFYTMLGDSEPVWRDPRYQTHLVEGVRWTFDDNP